MHATAGHLVFPVHFALSVPLTFTFNHPLMVRRLGIPALPSSSAFSPTIFTFLFCATPSCGMMLVHGTTRLLYRWHSSTWWRLLVLHHPILGPPRVTTSRAACMQLGLVGFHDGIESFHWSSQHVLGSVCDVLPRRSHHTAPCKKSFFDMNAVSARYLRAMCTSAAAREWQKKSRILARPLTRVLTFILT